jgi:hypothetical protein
MLKSSMVLYRVDCYIAVKVSEEIADAAMRTVQGIYLLPVTILKKKAACFSETLLLIY